ncbi:MAG TPA: globin domain-containing protein [Acidimicrobiales bacterium]|nr:globin domain-containing protein [Acidimicrobiales bacterium]
MALDVELLRSSFALVAEREPQLTIRFYEILFDRYPQVRPLFGVWNRNQAQMLQDALMAVVDHLEDAPWLASTLAGLGRTHLDYGVTPEMFAWVGECLLATLADVAGRDWTPALEAAWAEAYGAVAGLMQEGMTGAVPARKAS